MTFGILLVGAGVIGLIFATSDGIEPTRVFAGALVVVGAALVVDDLVRSRRRAHRRSACCSSGCCR